ncbi:Paired amphipathic helix protein like [Actinidia chinensis var. chinensis]|uniref:Paired amphipathic helix protein like n=1 Tax=Actinidia chinensis var. chinensis TaxID=1590841 RepID=A0A2R6PBI2_ACTCC|nr:Paired amphipathic helix protein like [Actinidia chinensis var. chinensis]
MAEASRSHVTITLRGSGQVVKRGGAVANSVFSHSQTALGSKRSVRDRLGSDVDRIQLNSKRQRGDSNGVDDTHLGKDDLRFKLMRKNVKRRGQTDVQRNGVDLRETLFGAVRPPTTSLSMHQLLPEPMHSRHLVPKRKDASILGRIPPARGADAFPRMDSLRNSYSPWTLDQLRKRSPDRVLRTSRNLSPRRNEEEITKRPLIRTYDEARIVSYMNSDILELEGPWALHRIQLDQ